MAKGDATVEVDHDACIVSGLCASLAPEVFAVADDDSELILLMPRIGPESAIAAEDSCPAGAIYVTLDTD